MPSSNAAGSHQALLRQAAEHINAGRLQPAEALIRQALSQSPRDHQGLNMLGVVALRSGQGANAAQLFNKAIAVKSDEAEYHSNLGAALLNVGHPNDGARALTTALSLQPSHPMANYNLGLYELQQGRFADARRHLEKAVKKMPQNPGAANALGVAHSKCGEANKAQRMFRTALKSQPNNPETKMNLAGALTELGQYEEAIALYEQLIAAHPGNARLFFNLGVAQRNARRYLDAKVSYRQALAIAPDYVDAHINLSGIHALRGELSAALEHILAADAQRPGDLHIMSNLARAQRDAGRAEAALDICDRILQADPENADAMAISMDVLQQDGRFEDARALAEGHKSVPVLTALANDRAYVFTPDDMQTLQDAAAEGEDDPKAAAGTWFALGRIHHNRGEHDAAFSDYRRANALMDTVYDWSEEDENELFSDMVSVFDGSFFETAPEIGFNNERPVFIVGMPRSGTTLVEQMIASHPNAGGGGERTDIQIIAEDLASQHAPSSYPACVANIDEQTAHRFARQYLDRLSQDLPDAMRVTDKMPENYIHLGLIQRLLPHARVIHCRRAPMATCFSIYQQQFRGYHPYAYDLAKLGRRYRNYEKLMRHWHDVLPLNILDIDYEDVVADPEAQARRILDFCDLDWDPQVLDFHETRRTVQTASLWQVRQPIYTTALEAWRAYEDQLGPLKTALSDG